MITTSCAGVRKTRLHTAAFNINHAVNLSCAATPNKRGNCPHRTDNQQELGETACCAGRTAVDSRPRLPCQVTMPFVTRMNIASRSLVSSLKPSTAMPAADKR